MEKTINFSISFFFLIVIITLTGPLTNVWIKYYEMIIRISMY